MQGEEANTTPPATLTQPASEPLLSVLVPEVDTKDDDPDELFLNAVAEIDTQPLVKLQKGRAITLADVLQTIVCVSLIGVGLFGIMWQAITYPHTLVILFASEKPASITAALAIPTRTLAPVTVTRSLTALTTGHGHQDARAATGSLTFYNGLFTPQAIAMGTVFTGSDGVKVSTDESVTIPAANPPQFAEATVPAHTLETGTAGNIHTGDINTTIANGVLVKNSQFTGGRDARDFRAVAQTDLDTGTTTLKTALVQQIPQAFILRPGETVTPTMCTFTLTADHAIGEEATTLKVTARDTCKGVAYSQAELTKQATLVFITGTRPAGYQLVDDVKTSILSVTPFQVRLTGSWAYTITSTYEQHLAEKIAGDTPQKARAYLLSTGVIVRASVPSPLPPAMYIDFLVLEEA